MFSGLFPRAAMIILWIARPDRIDETFSSVVWPVLGIIFLPFATLIYTLLWVPGRGVTSWDWWWVGFAALLDVVHLLSGAGDRRRARRRASADYVG